MKISILRDAKGQILATYQPAVRAPASVKPKVEKEHKVEEMEVSEDYASDINAFHDRYRKSKKQGKQ